MNFHISSNLKKLELRNMKMHNTSVLLEGHTTYRQAFLFMKRPVFATVTVVLDPLFKELVLVYTYSQCRMLAHFQKSKTFQMIFANLSYPPYFLC